MRGEVLMRVAAAVVGAGLLVLVALGGSRLQRAIARFREPVYPDLKEELPPPKPVPLKHVPRPVEPAPLPPPKAPEEDGMATCAIIPLPKVYKEKGRKAELLGGDAAAIVVSAKASDVERYAAERFQRLVARRFKRQLPIQVDGEVADGVKQAILLGVRATNRWLDRLCTEKGLDLGEKAPGQDGFIIEVTEDGGRQVILVGGSDPRGVIYGQEAFFDMLAREGDRIVFPVASVRYWPSIPWRGRPAWRPEYHLAPGVFDLYARGRLNWLDLRDGPAPRRGGFGCPPGFKPDTPMLRQVLAEARRRAMFVYGTVRCGVKPDEFEAVLRTFEDLIAFGADGLWISFDDPGGGEGTGDLVRRILELGVRHGMTGPRIAILPPMGSYERIATDFNREMAKVPGTADVRWIFAIPPSEGDVQAARKLGLTRPPSWWHNWPVEQGGSFLHLSGTGTLREGGKPLYLELSPLSCGWGNPSYDALRSAPANVDAVMFWGWEPEEYWVHAFGAWAWHPEKHDWARTRQAVYAWVFGPAQAAAAQAFDAKLAELKSFFILPYPAIYPGYNWPARLARAEEGPKAAKLLDEMAALLQALETRAPEETMVEATRLQEQLLEPMRATITYARAMADWSAVWAGIRVLEERIGDLLTDGDEAAAEQALLQAREKLLGQLDRAEAGLKGLLHLKEYFEGTRKRLTAAFPAWKELAAQRQKGFVERFALLSALDHSKALAGMGKPLDGRPLPATGAALAELRPSDWLHTPTRYRGVWTAGLIKQGDLAAVGLGHPHLGSWHPVEPGEYAEVRSEMPVPPFQGHLRLRAFVAAGTDNQVGASCLSAQLWANDKLLLDCDVSQAVPGDEWLSADITELAKDMPRLKLRFRVTNRRMTGRFHGIAYLGPVRLYAE